MQLTSTFDRPSIMPAARDTSFSWRGDRIAGALFIAFPLLVQLPFGVLSAQFGYPDVLRQPAGTVLEAFHAGGRGLTMVWYAYAMCIAVFAAAVLRFDRGSGSRRTATWLAMASALVQWIALARWTFLVPLLARQHAVAPDAAARAPIELLFEAQNHLLGVGVGEHLGQLLMAAWTIAMIPLLPGMHRAWRVVARVAAGLFVVGLLEQLGTAVGFDAGLAAHAPLVAFVVWSVWLVAVGVHLVRSKVHSGVAR